MIFFIPVFQLRCKELLLEDCILQLTLKLGGATSGRGPNALSRFISFSLVRQSEACGCFP